MTEQQLNEDMAAASADVSKETIVDDGGTVLSSTETIVQPAYTKEDEARDRARVIEIDQFTAVDYYDKYKTQIDAFFSQFTREQFQEVILALGFATFNKAVGGSGHRLDPVAMTVLNHTSATTTESLQQYVLGQIKARLIAQMKASGAPEGIEELLGGVKVTVVPAEAANDGANAVDPGEGSGGNVEGLPEGVRVVTEDELIAALSSEFGRPATVEGEDQIRINGVTG